MKLILLSGGSGKRLWPLSNEIRSKQFLRLLPSQVNGLESMVQRVWRQLGFYQLQQDAYIGTGAAQSELLQSQLGAAVPLIIEPARKDTFPAIALASTYLHTVIGASVDEVIAVCPVDLYVENKFFLHVKQLEHIHNESGADIALIGVTPAKATGKYGYIIPERDPCNNQTFSYMKVQRFVEKPTEHHAKQLIQQGALWNCGVFAFRIGLLIDHLAENGWPIDYDELLQQYERLPQISFDYEIVEKAKQIVVMPYTGEWKDVGSWDTLTDSMQTNVQGNAYVSSDSENSHVINELEFPVVVSGLSNIIVAVSPDGVLVSDKSKSDSVKETLKDTVQRVMFEEYGWGWKRVLLCRDKTVVKHVCIIAHKSLQGVGGPEQNEIWVMISGEAKFIAEGNSLIIKARDVINIPASSPYTITAMEEVEMIVIAPIIN